MGLGQLLDNYGRSFYAAKMANGRGGAEAHANKDRAALVAHYDALAARLAEAEAHIEHADKMAYFPGCSYCDRERAAYAPES